MSSMRINDNAMVAARRASGSPHRSFAHIDGHQYTGHDGETRRFVGLSFHSAERYGVEPMYAALHLTPDEARGLAARLLDAADTADENIDAPIAYSLA
jgi:hypothetical protein